MKAFLQHPLAQKALPAVGKVAALALIGAWIGANVLAWFHAVIDVDAVWPYLPSRLLRGVLGLHVPPEATSFVAMTDHALAWMIAFAANTVVGCVVVLAVLRVLHLVLNRIAQASEAPRPSESSYTVEQRRAILERGMAARKVWARRVAFERYGYTGSISTEQDAALSRDLSPTEAARLFPVRKAN